MRGVGDPVLDAAVADCIAQHGHAWLRGLMAQLFRCEALPPSPLLDALQLPLSVDAEEQARIVRGQRLFGLYGPEILLILACYALPLAYAAGAGVQVIHRSRRLHDDGLRRLVETAQMVINVMGEGQLTRPGAGTEAVFKVRLIHALVRYQVENAEDSTWNPAWGTAINQEDLAGTLLTFSLVPLDGLLRMGVRISDAEREGYLSAWAAVGRLLGVDDALIPRSEADARRLAAQIGRRQMRATPEGRALSADLLAVIEGLVPVHGYGVSLTRFFLERTDFGYGMAELLDVPPANWTRFLVRARALQKRLVMRALPHVPGATGRRRFFARRFVQALIVLRRPDARMPFRIPPALERAWRLKP